MKGDARIALGAAIFLLWSAAAFGATRTWTGASINNPFPPNDNFWTNAFNWAGNVAPQPGDDLVFNGGFQGAISINTFNPDTTFNSITITNHAINGGNRVALNAFLSGTGALMNLPIILNASQTFTATTAGSGLTFNAGALIETNGNTLTLAGPGGFVLVGAISGSGGITKNGSGSLQFAGNHSYTGDTTINDGPVRIAGNHTGSRFVTTDGSNGLIGGSGTVKGLIASDPLDPGAANNGTGIFTSAGDLDITTNGSLQIDIKGKIPGTEFDQVQVAGAVQIDLITGLFGAGLNVELVGFTPAPGDRFVIISNDGTDPVSNGAGSSTGFFARAEGSTFTVPNSSGGSTTFFITYKGGDGNDVALHVPAVRTWDGGGSNNNWMTAANWVGDVAPAAGDTLVFPPSAARRTNTNNFPAGTKFNSISIDGSYNLGGNAIVLQAGMASTGNTGHSVNLSGIKLDANQSFTRDGQGDLNVASSIDTNGKTLTLLSATDVGRQRYLLGGISGAGGINMAALNSAVFEGSNTYTGPTVISSGSLIVQGTQPASPVQMTGGKLLGHLGEVGPLTATGGTISPFFGGPGTLGVNGNLTLNSAAILEISLARDSNGVLFAGKLEVAGVVDLGGSTLSLSFFFSPPQTGDEVTIIDNDGTDPVVGTFGSLSEGALFAFGNATIQISYQGGDGNDVILRVTAVAPVGIGLVKFTNGTDNDAPPGPAEPVGSTVTFHYVVTNTGSTPLEGVRVKDDNGTPGVAGDDFTLTAPIQGDTNENDLLDPGETFIFSASRIATEGQHTNIGEARGSGVPFGPIVTASNADNHFGGTPPPPRLGNISTRLRVEAGDNALIGGFIVTGSQDKRVMIRAIGPSLAQFFSDALANPKLELFQGNTLLRSNDDWKDTQQAEIEATTIPPGNDLESAIVMTLPANNNGYTAIVRGVNNGTGVGLVEIYDLDPSVDSKLANISTRGFVQTGDNVLIAGTIVTGSGSQKVIIRAIGPSLQLAGKLEDPKLELRDQNGALLQENDNWKTQPNGSSQQAEVEATTIPPTSDFESAIVATLPAANAGYTAIVRGVNNSSGIAVIEVYALQ
jgi:autotransporter-associated beta strand protein